LLPFALTVRLVVHMSQLLDARAGVLNACEPVPGLVTGGQPLIEHLDALKRAGCSVVVDVRDPMEEQPFDAPATVRAAGLDYLNIPVSHTPLDDRALEEVRRALRDVIGPREAFWYCNSGNRVGAALIPFLMLDRRFSEETAVEAAMRMGTRHAELLEWALDYVRRHQV
jgi:protein tyrosine phosphatase (PTP) superfamily phosphohydrolase (DUF442 family)